MVEAWNGSAWVPLFTINTGTNGWQNFNFCGLPTFSNGGVTSSQVRFISESGGATLDFFGDPAIDDVCIIEAPACPGPSAAVASNVTDVSADLSWTISATCGGTPPSVFKVEYGPCGFTPGTGTIITGITSTTQTITGLAPASCIDVYVLSDCSAAGNGCSAPSGPTSISTLCPTSPIGIPYCENFLSLIHI